ncbi:MAG: hypothetical protein ACXWXQ_10945 [Actinomycetota bacterium]
METSVERGAGTGVLVTARRLSAAVAAGLVTGALIGGIGGRIAMFVLRLTSDPSVRGLESDDGFTIGVVSSATLFLVVFTMVLGLVGAIAYLGIRSWLPERWRPWLFGSLTGLLGGALIVHPDGIDFTSIEPAALAIAMFVVIPAAYGVATSLLVERFLRDDSMFAGSRASLALLAFLLPLGLLGPTGLAVLAVILAALVLRPRVPGLAGLWTSAPVTWLGRIALAAVAIAAAVKLTRDVTTLL